jgi:hypothetical protein
LGGSAKIEADVGQHAAQVLVDAENNRFSAVFNETGNNF